MVEASHSAPASAVARHVTIQGEGMAAAAGTQYILVAFDSQRELDSRTVRELEHVLRMSDRFMIGMNIKVNAASLVKAETHAVNVLSIANVPAQHTDSFLASRVEAALNQIETNSSEFPDPPRNLGIIAFDTNMRMVLNSAKALGGMLNDVAQPGLGEPFGKLLRLFLPPELDLASADAGARTAAAGMFRDKLREHAEEMAEASKTAVTFDEPAAQEEADTGPLFRQLQHLRSQLGPDDRRLAEETSTVAASYRKLQKAIGAVISTAHTLGKQLGQLEGTLAKHKSPEVAGNADFFARFRKTMLDPLENLRKIVQ